MISNAQIKYINSLHAKKYRQKYQQFIAEGNKIVLELLNSSVKIHVIYAVKEWILNLKFDPELLGINLKLIEITEPELKKISLLTTPNQVIAIAEIPKYSLNKTEFNNHWSLALDNIQDPGNLGTIIRTADWFGISTILCSPDCADAFSSKVVQSSMGSVFRVKIHEIDLEEFFRQNTDVPILGAVLDGENIFASNFSDKGIILIGNESVGIHKNLLPFISQKITIPKYGKAESLNAAIAAGIICAVLKKQDCV